MELRDGMMMGICMRNNGNGFFSFRNNKPDTCKVWKWSERFPLCQGNTQGIDDGVGGDGDDDAGVMNVPEY